MLSIFVLNYVWFDIDIQFSKKLFQELHLENSEEASATRRTDMAENIPEELITIKEMQEVSEINNNKAMIPGGISVA